MLSAQKVHELLNKYQVYPSKRFGQNFLVDNLVIAQIVKAAQVADKDVVEIGPGLGFLTEALLEEAKSVTSFEIDEDMIKVLKGEILDRKFHLAVGDFLESDLKWKGKKTLVANIPYNITSDILFKLFENSQAFDSATIMVQKEVGERLLAHPNSSDYSKLTVTASHFAQISQVMVVEAKSFVPKPKVDSMVVKLVFNANTWGQSQGFVSFVKLCFAQRRKTLVNNLKLEIGKEKAEAILQKAQISLNARPQELSYQKFLELFSLL